MTWLLRMAQAASNIFASLLDGAKALDDVLPLGGLGRLSRLALKSK